MTKPPPLLLAAARAWARRPLFQDAALAVGLLVVCVPVNNPVAMLRTISALDAGPLSRAAVAWAWWIATAFALAGVALRRTWPLPMLGVCTLAVAAHLALLSAVPTTVDLSSVVLLATVATHCARRISVGALAAMSALVMLWCLAGARVGSQVRGLPTFSVEVVHHVGPPPAAGNGSVPANGPVGDVVDRTESTSPWSGVALLGSVLLAAWAIGSGARSRRKYLHELHARAQDLERERDQRAALAVAAERGRISRELHDVVAHGLALIVIQAQGAEAALDHRPDNTRAALRTIVTTGRDSLADMRRSLAALGRVEDAWHPQPGLAQLPALLDRVRETGTPVRLRIEGTPAALPSAVDLSAYRVVQEALTNVMKHAGTGASADIVVCYSENEVALEVCDDGVAAQQPIRLRTTTGNGLRGMDGRVKLLGGELTARPRPDGGFLVRARLPVREGNA
ncbi:sensor histidine kinase [Catenulispora yoronensis]